MIDVCIFVVCTCREDKEIPIKAEAAAKIKSQMSQPQPFRKEEKDPDCTEMN